MLERPDTALLRDLLAVLGGSGVHCFLIGAGARVLGLDEPCELSGARATLDWDFAVRVDSWEGWGSLRDRLLSLPGRRFKSTSAPHRFEHSEGRQLDLVPFGGVEAVDGEITWPDGFTMSVRGLSEAAEVCEAIEVEKGLRMQIACIPSLALLKLHAYLDRRARGISHDIQDFDWLLRHYDDLPGHAVRVHDELREPLIAGELETTEAGAMLLGADLARIHTTSVIDPLAGLLAEFGDPFGRPIEDVLRADRGFDEAEEQTLRGRIQARFRAFCLGLSPGSRG